MAKQASDFTVQVHSTTHTIDLAGTLSGNAVDWLSAAVEALTARGARCVTINGAGVDHVDAAALDRLVGLAEQALHCGSRLEISKPSPVFRNTLISGGCAALLAEPERRSHPT